MNDLGMAVVVRKDKILIQERFRQSKGMIQEFPGGSVDDNETGIQAAVRELEEETGLVELEVLGDYSYPNEYGGKIYFVILAGTDKEPEAIDADRQQTFKWLKPADIRRTDFYRADLEFIDTKLHAYT
ncbi:NUDIX hydrolase [Reinekea forsetii]|nr:NUDIX hydrolase [Reinekea forsetii]